MRVILYICIYMLIFFETAVYATYPYYAIALSFVGYIAYKKNYKSVIFAIGVALIVGVSGEHITIDILFYALYFFFMVNVYKYLYFEKINILIISFIETFLYVGYIYIFKINEILPIIWVKEFIFVVIYNYIFAKLEKNMGKE